jgi:hypothetical protein
LLAVLLMGFAGATFGAVRFDVVPSPTEVVNTGRSEVTGSVNLIVRGAGNVTGTSQGGATQIGLIYTNPAMQIDNTTASGIKLFYSAGFTSAFVATAASGSVGIIGVSNIDINGRCYGLITINMAPGAAPVEGDFIRVEGVRGRIDASLAITPGTDLYVDLQSINDPSANAFTPDRIRVAKSLDGMNVKITPDTLLLCFPTTGKPTAGTAIPSYGIEITEGFTRAFVDADSNGAGVDASDRVDSGGLVVGGVATSALQGAPTNSTQFVVWMEGIPTSVSGISWPASSTTSAGGASQLNWVSNTFSSSAGTASAVYSYETTNQTGASDVQIETFKLVPVVVLNSTTATSTGTIVVGVTLAPTTGAATGCASPSATPSRPRFLEMYESDDVATNNPPSDPFKPYAQVIRCNCYLLYTFAVVTKDFNTGIAVANTTGDTAPFGTNEAADQLGKVTFYFYDYKGGYVGSTVTASDIIHGRSFVDVMSNILPTGVTSFQGYVIAKADFQFCHGYAYIYDANPANPTGINAAQGYVANVIPDPAIKNLGGRRAPAAAADATNIPAGEGLNN